MKKRHIICTVLISLFTFHTALGRDASCDTQFSGTDFKPKVAGSSVYSLDDVIFYDASSEFLTVNAQYHSDPSTLKAGQYCVTSEGLLIGLSPSSSRENIITYSLKNLTSGNNRDYSKIYIDFTTKTTSDCGVTNGQINWEVLYNNDGNQSQVYPYWKFTKSGTAMSFSQEFKTKSDMTSNSIRINDNNSSFTGCVILVIKKILVKGCYDPRVVSENGSKFCQGEANTFSFKGPDQSSYQWEMSTDGKKTWQALPGNAKSITTEISADRVYVRVKAGGTYYTTDEIRSVICCSADGTKQEIIKESFTLDDAASKNKGSNQKRLEFFKGNSRFFGGNFDTYYQNPTGSPGNYSIDADQCAVVNSANAGNWWHEVPILEGHTGNGDLDGFLLVNCAVAKGNIFKYTSTQKLCENTLYNFSAWIANAISQVGKDAAPINVSFIVNGLTTNEKLLEISTGDLESGTTWVEQGGSFNSGRNTAVELILRNNLDPAEKYLSLDKPDVVGNDVGLDDVLFTSCAPSITLYSNTNFKSKDTIVCNNGSPANLKLQPNASYDLSTFFATPHYLYQVSPDKKNWSNVGSISTTEQTTITADPTTHKNGLYYRVWVGGSEQAINNAVAGHQVTTCGMLTAVSDPIKISYSCPCRPSAPPSVKDYNECPITTGTATLDLNSLVTGNYTKLTWYENATIATPMTNTNVDAKTVQTKTYYVTNNDGAPTYCESDRVLVTVKVKDAVKFNITPSDITTCLFQGADLTYTVSNKIPSSATITWRNGTTDLGTGDSYTLPAQPGTGTITAVASDPAKTACDFSKDVTYNLTPVNKFNLDASPAYVCTGNPVSTITATIVSGTGNYTLFKDGTPVKSGTVTPNDKTISHTDTQVGTSAGKVSYSMEFGTGNCKDVQTTDVTVGAEFEISIKSNAADNRVCESYPFSLTAEYQLKAGESLIWKKDGVTIPGSDVKLDNLTISSDATYTVELVGGSCAGKGSINMYADHQATPNISASTSAVCEGYSFDLTDKDPVTATSYQWQMQTNGGAWTDMTGEKSKTVTGYTPASTASYRLTAQNGLCPSVSNVVEVVVTPPPSILSITDASVCLSNPEATLVAEIDNDNIPYVWSKNGATFDSGTIPAGASKITLTDSNVATSIGTVKYSLTIGSGSCSDTKETKVEVSNKTSITLMSDAANDRVCAGNQFSVTALYTLQAGESLEWTKDGVTLTETGVKIENETIDKNTLYTVTLNGGLCSGDGSLQMYADTPPAPVIDASKKNICKGSVIDLTDSDPSAVTKYEWEMKTGARYKVMEGKSTKDIMAYMPDETASYRLTAINGVCIRVSNEVSVTVNPLIEFNVSKDQSICDGGEATLTMSGYPSTATVGWYNGQTQISQSESVTVKPSITTVYTAEVVDVCIATKSTTVNVEPAIEVHISPDTQICAGESAKLSVSGGKTYSWTPAASLSDPSSDSPTASPKVTTTYSVTVSTDLCSTSASTTVKVNPLPVIDSVTETEPGEATAVVSSGTEPFLYSINNKDFDASNVITGIPIGHHILYVVDNAGCKAQADFDIEPVPITPDVFFTPNDDGVNELWTVKGLNAYTSYVVEIFDRFGKRLYVFKKGGYSADKSEEDFTGWDGIYNGHQMPATDYWYLITVEEIRKQFNGHFTLKR